MAVTTAGGSLIGDRQYYPSSTLADKLPSALFQQRSELRTKLHAIEYRHSSFPWRMAIATVASADCFSLGGFRIAPAERRRSFGFSALNEASALALGMEEKVFWSRQCELAGPVGKTELHRIFGGKCVLDPGEDHQVGKTGDTELLEFAAQVFLEFERETGVRLVTGQDLGHGQLTNGESSLHFLSQRFRGCVQADTSAPTAYGNLGVVLGIAQAAKRDVSTLRVGILGCGNIGRHLALALSSRGAELVAIDSSEHAAQWCRSQGIPFFSPTERTDFLSSPMDILCVNAAGGSLDSSTVEILCQNERLMAVTGCENLALAEAGLADNFRKHKKLFTPTEYCGMFGYLTAVESYLNPTVSVEEMQRAALEMRHSACLAASDVLHSQFSFSFEEALLDKKDTEKETLCG